jgi:hypothetical protein
MSAAQPVASGQTGHQMSQDYVNTVDAVLQQSTYEHLHLSTPREEPSQYQNLSKYAQEDTNKSVIILVE